MGGKVERVVVGLEGGPERRFTGAEAAAVRIVERKASANGAAVALLRGMAAVFNVWSPVWFDFRERIAATFFDGVLGQDVRCLFNHGADYVLGRASSGTLRLEKTDEGLGYEVDAPGSGFLSDLVVGPVERGDVTGCSFSFILPPSGADSWEKGPDGVWERTLLKCAELLDVGPVTFPWYPGTSVEAERAIACRTAAIARGEVAGVVAPPGGPGWEAELRLREMRLP
ncbi:MAG: HK97 family phage prohead protease [Myxococcales bacterium]|nr:HK97 family phage prohead protease [Myxococcales bacterium]